MYKNEYKTVKIKLNDNERKILDGVENILNAIDKEGDGDMEVSVVLDAEDYDKLNDLMDKIDNILCTVEVDR